MKAAIFEAPGRIRVRKIRKPTCENDSIIVRVEACGICGSDIRNFHRGLRYGIKSQVMGHEISGIVEEKGKSVTKFQIGDMVAIASDVGCGACFYCKQGFVNLCINHRMVGTHFPGGFAQYIKIPFEVIRSGMVNEIPEGIGFKEATLSEPLSAVINIQEEAGISPGDKVLIFGDGPVGCMHLQIARSRGAGTVIMVGLKKMRLADRFEPDFLFDAAKIDPVKAVHGITDGLGVDVAICANPSPITQEQAIEAVRKRGKVILFGGMPEDRPFVSLNSNLIHYNEIMIMGAFSSPSYMKKVALQAIKNKQISPEKYIDKIVNIESIVEGMKDAEKGNALKVVVKPWI